MNIRLMKTVLGEALAALLGMGIAFALLAFTATPARADTITVTGTVSTIDILVPDLLAMIDLTVDPNGSFDFALSYDACQPSSQGFITVHTYDAAHQLVDTLDLNPILVTRIIQNDREIDSLILDHWSAGTADDVVVNGTPFIVVGHLEDRVDHDAINGPELGYLNDLARWPFAGFGIGVTSEHFSALSGTITSLTATAVPAECPVDSDGDGIIDANDQCPGTLAGGTVDNNGCTIEQLAPCGGPAAGGRWRNHGQYVKEVAHATQLFVDTGLITAEQQDAIMTAAATSSCGH